MPDALRDLIADLLPPLVYTSIRTLPSGYEGESDRDPAIRLTAQKGR